MYNAIQRPPHLLPYKTNVETGALGQDYTSVMQGSEMKSESLLALFQS